jgi:hypothetical protein
MAVRLSALRAGHPLALQEDSWYSFLLEAESTPGPQRKIYLVGTRTRDLPACSIVPQPTTLPRAPEDLRKSVLNVMRASLLFVKFIGNIFRSIKYTVSFVEDVGIM